MSDQSVGLEDFTTDLLREAVKSIKIESAYGPTIELNDPFAPADPNAPGAVLLRKLKPKITLQTAGGPMVIMPYGEPGPSRWKEVETGGLLVIALGIFGIFMLARVASRNRKDRKARKAKKPETAMADPDDLFDGWMAKGSVLFDEPDVITDYAEEG